MVGKKVCPGASPLPQGDTLGLPDSLPQLFGPRHPPNDTRQPSPKSTPKKPNTVFHPTCKNTKTTLKTTTTNSGFQHGKRSKTPQWKETPTQQKWQRHFHTRRQQPRDGAARRTFAQTQSRTEELWHFGVCLRFCVLCSSFDRQRHTIDASFSAIDRRLLIRANARN